MQGRQSRTLLPLLSLSDVDTSGCSIAHFEFQKMTIQQPTKVMAFSAVLKNPSFSLLGVVWRKLRSAISLPMHSLVLIFQQLSAANTTLHLYLIPDDISVKQVRWKAVQRMTSGVAAVAGSGSVKQRALSLQLWCFLPPGISLGFWLGQHIPACAKTWHRMLCNMEQSICQTCWLLPCTVIGGCIADALLLRAALTL